MSGGINDKTGTLRKSSNPAAVAGVYIIRDKDDTIIYIGKAKRLKIRVSQYFKEGNVHLPKVQKMVEHAFSFDVIVTNSEIEALHFGVHAK